MWSCASKEDWLLDSVGIQKRDELKICPLLLVRHNKTCFSSTRSGKLCILIDVNEKWWGKVEKRSRNLENVTRENRNGCKGGKKGKGRETLETNCTLDWGCEFSTAILCVLYLRKINFFNPLIAPESWFLLTCESGDFFFLPLWINALDFRIYATL